MFRCCRVSRSERENFAQGRRGLPPAPAHVSGLHAFLAAAAALGACLALAPAAWAETPAGYLQKQTRPVFKEGHGLPRLTRFGWTLPFEARVELARHWGYALELGGYATEKVAARLDDPDSLESRLVELARSEPETFPLQVILSRDLPTGDVKAVAEPPTVAATEPAEEVAPAKPADDAHFRRPGANPPGDPWTRNAKGELVDGKRIWSPEAADDIIAGAASLRAEPLREIARRAPVAVVLNGGEYALNVLGFARKHWEQDPRIEAARGETPWFEYISQRKAYMERRIAEAVRKAAPDRQLYIYYTAGGGTHRNRYGGWANWAYGFDWMQHVSDLPSNEFYYRHFNSGWTGKMSMLTQALNAKGYELEFGKPLGYNWLCAGWPRGEDDEAKQRSLGGLDRYMGFLKCLYTTGMVAGNAGYYAYPKGGFDAEFPEGEPPHWLRQMIVLAHAHALFSHLENYLRHADLVPGPNMHVWSKSQPAYELPTGDDTVRVVARRHRERAEWLITAWAAAGDAREVTVDVPDLGDVRLHARPGGSVYLAEADPAGAVRARLIDRDPMLPSHSAGRALAGNHPPTHKPTGERAP